MVNKRGDWKRIGLILIVAALLFGAFVGYFVLAETAEEEKARLLEEKQELEQRLQEIDNGKWVNVSVEELIANTTYSELLIDNSTTLDDLVPLELKCGNYELYNKNSLISSNDFYFTLWNETRIRLTETISNELPMKSVYHRNQRFLGCQKSVNCERVRNELTRISGIFVHVNNYNCDDIGYWTSLSNNNQSLDHQTLSADSIALIKLNGVRL